ncbi:MAG: MIP/aquaporin family protein [Flavobacteriales bacterium]
MTPAIAEFIGTALLILVGCSVNANVVLTGTKGQNSGWTVITLGWGLAVFLGVYTATHLGGSGHLNPAVTLGLAMFKEMDTALVPGYLIGQLSGAMLGATLTWSAFHPHFRQTENPDLKLAVFSTSPAIRNLPSNFVTEVLGTFVLMLGALTASPPSDSLGALDALPVALLVMGIGAGLGGPTGYAINPARDLGPRIMHQLLPISKKGDSDWPYAWIPVLAPIIGSTLAVGLYIILRP